ncbi:hypothetical protein FHR24_003078 [Wenyingzhuangia heitensis]|uniref:Novel STAND NTPase 3 domain-containing protein n=1 Tax=Wenyingzhuangia heitensis TaxID=1487859 RepID=A0ABX0UCP9_9FLAO|nr:hypothetical protein [Wenyingzhuangia heitensis]NIJ46588.1 hypothetical protein [Wenyingzhuangia heitensis]
MNQQKNFNTHFGNTILPLNSKELNIENINSLKEGFYEGISVRYEHILADLDILRIDKLNAIDNNFQKNNIVFIHGASGQGKSTLAYRYLHNYIDSNAVYELKLSNNINDVYEVISSLNALCEGLDFPITVYIDVQPQSNYWNDVLKELSNKNNLQFLITIRQEDWNRTILGEDYNFSNIELSFNEEEAKIIYTLFSQYKTNLIFTDFNESWIQFGSKGMLLEYVYLITQGDKLKIRLKNQINRLENENKTTELEILRYACLADSFNSRIQYKEIINRLNIERSLSNLHIKLLEKEYLLKFVNDRKYLTGLHPIRSQLLCEILFDENDYINRDDYINDSISMVNEEDLHTYLLNSFDKGYHIEQLLKNLDSKHFYSWAGYNNITKALIWKGVKDYIFIKNIDNFNILYKDYAAFWTFLIPHDYSDVTDGSLHEIFKEYMSADVNDKIKNIQSNFSPKEDVYDYVLKWLSTKLQISILEEKETDLIHLGEFFFWVGYLKLKVSLSINEEEILKIFSSNNISVKNASFLLLGIQFYNYNSKEFISKLQEILIKHIRKKYNIINLKINDLVDCTYFYNLIEFEIDSEIVNNFFNNRSMEIIHLLRNIYPHKEKYSIRGTGSSFFGINLPHDPTIKNIERKKLPIPFLVEVNILIANLYSFQFRCDSWIDYSKKIYEKRITYNTLCTKLTSSFVHYFRKNNYSVFIEIVTEIEEELKSIKTIPLPKNISDKWGYISEGQNENSLEELTERKGISASKIASLKHYNNYRKNQRDYFSSLDNFLKQIGSNILSLYNIRINGNLPDDYNSNVLSSNIKDAIINHKPYVFEFENHFNNFLKKKEFEKLENTEEENLRVLFYCWKQFLNQKGSVNNKIRKNTAKSFIETKTNLNKRLIKERQNILNEMGLSFTVEVSEKTDGKLLLTCEVNSETYLASCIIARMLLQRSLNSDFFSLKKLIIDLNIKSAIYIPLFNGNPLNQTAVEISLYNLEKEIDDDGNNALLHFNLFYKIDDNIINHLKLEFWNEMIEAIKQYETFMGEITSLVEIQNQIRNIDLDEKDDEGKLIFNEYIDDLNTLMKKRIDNAIFSIKAIDIGTDIMKSFNILENLDTINLKEDKNGFEDLKISLTNNYYSFCENKISELFLNS